MSDAARRTSDIGRAVEPSWPYVGVEMEEVGESYLALIWLTRRCFSGSIAD